MAKIGVFDSGVGGLSVARSIERALPDETVIFACDKENMPYGNKSPEQVLGFVMPILQGMVNEGCQTIVIACNTVTTTLIEELRNRLPVPLVGIEPMVKPAAKHSKTGVVAVCATPSTIASKRYAWLKETYAQGLIVIEPDCSDWAYMIEHHQLNEQQIRRQVDDICNQGADVIVLGCTHYHWIQSTIQKMAGNRAIVVQPEEPVIRQLKRVLAATKAL